MPILDQSAKDYRDLLSALSNKRQIMGGSTSASLMFQAVDGKVIATGLQMKFSDMFYTWSSRKVEYDEPHITVSSGFATEAQLLQARSMVPAVQVGQIDALLKMVRDGVTPPAPIRVEITNTDQLQRDTILSIKRDDTGKVSGATAMKV